LAAAPDGTRLYLCDSRDRVHALALEEGGRARWLDWPLSIHATALALSPDGRTLALGDRERPGSVALVDTSRGVETGRLHVPTGDTDGQVSSLAFAPNGRELVVGTTQGMVDLWSLDHLAAPQIRLSGHRGMVNVLAFDPQGRRLASGGTDRTVNVWDLSVIRDELRRLGLAW
jgi:WD40 repeat protein